MEIPEEEDRCPYCGAECGPAAELTEPEAWMEDGEEEPDKAPAYCELCGRGTEKVYSVKIEDSQNFTFRDLCEDCLQRTGAQKIRGKWTVRVGVRPVQPHRGQGIQETGNTGFAIIRESDEGRSRRLETIERKLRTRHPQEAFFLEELDEENSLSDIAECWESYDLGDDYPEIDAQLAALAKKEAALNVSFAAVNQVKQELRALFRDFAS